MIRNGLYSYESKALDGGDGGYRGVMVLRDGSILGGGSFFYFIGTYSCSGGRWKGEATQQEHTSAPHTFATAGWKSAPDLPERIRMRVPNSKPQRSWVREAFDTVPLCGCW